MGFHLWLLIFATLFVVAHAGSFVPPADWCLPSAHLKELTGCITMTDKEAECEGKASDDEKLDCYCTQEMFSSFFDCKSDITRCLESHMFDPQFDEKVRRWHEACDSRMDPPATTPAEPTLTTTYDFRACGRLQQSCQRADYETNICSKEHLPTSSISFTSCFCQPSAYALISACQYDGNVSCLRTSAAESNIMGYSFCSYFWSGSETLSSVDLTSFLSATDPPRIAQLTVSSAVQPSPTGFITATATKTAGGGKEPVGGSAQDELK